jgi:hypothetical protein
LEFCHQFRVQAEIDYDNGSYGTPCTDLASLLVDANDCSSDGTDFAAWGDLDDGGYWCVDSDGFTDEVSGEPTGNSCQ